MKDAIMFGLFVPPIESDIEYQRRFMISFLNNVSSDDFLIFKHSSSVLASREMHYNMCVSLSKDEHIWCYSFHAFVYTDYVRIKVVSSCPAIHRTHLWEYAIGFILPTSIWKKVNRRNNKLKDTVIGVVDRGLYNKQIGDNRYVFESILFFQPCEPIIL